MTLRKRFQLKWVFEAPDAIMACVILKCRNPNKEYIIFGGHDKTLYMMDLELRIVCSMTFDGWVRCIYPIDLDGDGVDELLVGSGDGSCMVLKFDREKEHLTTLMKYMADGMVICCTAGDLIGDGTIAIIFGCADKTLKIFTAITDEEPKFTIYYASWVTQCNIGLLELPEFRKPIHGLIVGTKKGVLQLIILEQKTRELMPNILWQRYLQTRINIIAIGDVTNDGFNDIVVSTNDSFIKILNSEAKNIKYIRVYNGKSISLSRPLAIKIEDIDGDNSNEIIAGCADGTLRVYHNTQLKSHSFKLKWKTKVSTSIKDICTIDDPEKNVKNLIFGGYDRTLRNVIDFEWGKKPVLEVPEIITKLVKSSEKEPEEFEIITIPTNIKEYIVELFNEKSYYSSKELLLEELIAMGYRSSTLNTEVEQLIKNRVLIQETKNIAVWKLAQETANNITSTEGSKSEGMLKLTEREKIIQKEMDENPSPAEQELDNGKKDNTELERRKEDEE